MKVAVISDSHGDLVALDCPVGPRLDAYGRAALELTPAERDRLLAPAGWPVRSAPGDVVQLWP